MKRSPTHSRTAMSDERATASSSHRYHSCPPETACCPTSSPPGPSRISGNQYDTNSNGLFQKTFLGAYDSIETALLDSFVEAWATWEYRQTGKATITFRQGSRRVSCSIRFLAGLHHSYRETTSNLPLVHRRLRLCGSGAAIIATLQLRP
jgi:hypothetical protein